MRIEYWVGSSAVVLATAVGGCDIVAGIGEYCEKGVDCPTSGSGAGGVGGATGGNTSTGGGSGGTSGACTPTATQPCAYTGDPATENKGECHAGKQTCGADGTWRPCEGEVTPGEEKPDVPGDEACDGYSPGEALWSRIWGDSGMQFASDVAIDAGGNIYVAGPFSGGLNLDPPLVAAGTDAFVTKLDPTGKPLWSVQLGDAASQHATSIAVDKSSNVFVAGIFAGEIKVGDQTLSSIGANSNFVVKLDSEGNPVWARQIGSGNILASQPAGLSATPEGDVVVSGGFKGTLNVSGNTLVSGGDYDIFVCKLSAAGGTPLWAKRFGGMLDQFAPHAAVDIGGNIVVSGLASGSFSVNFDDVTVVSGEVNLFVLRLDAQGNAIWLEGFGGEHGTHDIGVDGLGGIFLSGRFAGTTKLGDTPFTSQSQSDLFLLKLDANGKHVRSRFFGDPSFLPIGKVTDYGPALAVSADGATAITFHAGGTINLGGELLDGAAASDFVGVFDPQGNPRWSKVFGQSANEGSCAAGVMGSGDVVLACGVNASTTDYGNGPLPGAGGHDLTAARFAP